MKCKLCLEDKPLIKAHIIPKFLYKNSGLYESDLKGQGRIHVGKISNDKFSYNPKGLPDGEYDQNILCSNCDNIVLQSYEDYGKKVLFDGNRKLFKLIKATSLGYEYALVKNIDYAKFKIFLISIFWRASISDRIFSKEVNLGNETNEIIRKMIIEKDPKEPEDFCTIIYLIDEPPLTSSLMTNFKKIVVNNTTKYVFIGAGMIFSFFPNKNDIPENHKPFVFAKNGELKIYYTPKDKIRQILNSFFEKYIF
jgi:hypothetical protein